MTNPKQGIKIMNIKKIILPTTIALAIIYVCGCNKDKTNQESVHKSSAKQQHEPEQHQHGPECNHEPEQHQHGPECNHENEQTASCLPSGELIVTDKITIDNYKFVVNQIGHSTEWKQSAGFKIQFSSQTTPTVLRALIRNNKGEESIKSKAHSHGKTFHLHVDELPKITPKSILILELQTDQGKKITHKITLK